MRALLRHSGFTLLEALLAIVILSGVLLVCLGIRSQSMRVSVDVHARLGLEREIDDLFTMVTTGTLPDPVIDRRARALTWEGEHLGEPFIIKATPVSAPNPVYGLVSAAVEREVTVWSYTIMYRGRTTEFLWR